ncbi:MAG: hypothetical protein JXR94_06555 [Candidatus Hydrogenedentes bacterium]|nr:hypothetical protein [Candidatus Hydrogenedentota bacterium]
MDPDPDSGDACTWRLRRGPEDGPALYDVTACTSTVPFRLIFRRAPLPDGSFIVWGRFDSPLVAGSVAEVTVLPDAPDSVGLELRRSPPSPGSFADRGFRARFTASGDLVWAQKDVQWARLRPYEGSVGLADGGVLYADRLSEFDADSLKRLGVESLGPVRDDEWLILRTGRRGELLWHTTIKARGQIQCFVSAFTDGSLLLFGYFAGMIATCGSVPLNVYSSGHNSALGDFDLFLIKIAQDGTMAWARFIGPTGLEWPMYDWLLGDDGSVLVLAIFADKVEVSRGQPDSVVLSDGIFELDVSLMAAKFDADGSLLWAEVCGSGWSEFLLKPTSEDNRYLVTGRVRREACFTRLDGSSITFPADGQGGRFEAIFETRSQ